MVTADHINCSLQMKPQAQNSTKGTSAGSFPLLENETGTPYGNIKKRNGPEGPFNLSLQELRRRVSALGFRRLCNRLTLRNGFLWSGFLGHSAFPSCVGKLSALMRLHRINGRSGSNLAQAVLRPQCSTQPAISFVRHRDQFSQGAFGTGSDSDRPCALQ
jgi:hypothetical protein